MIRRSWMWERKCNFQLKRRFSRIFPGSLLVKTRRIPIEEPNAWKTPMKLSTWRDKIQELWWNYSTLILLLSMCCYRLISCCVLNWTFSGVHVWIQVVFKKMHKHLETFSFWLKLDFLTFLDLWLLGSFLWVPNTEIAFSQYWHRVREIRSVRKQPAG